MGKLEELEARISTLSELRSYDVQKIQNMQLRIEELEKQSKGIAKGGAYPRPKEDSLEEVICESFENSPYKELEKTSEIVAQAVRKWIKKKLDLTGYVVDCDIANGFMVCMKEINQNLGLNEGSENE